MTFFDLYQFLATGLSLQSLANAVGDAFAFQRPAHDPLGTTPLPSLSVLIPARNEAATVGACVRSLCAQDYSGSLEILILDDGSTDGTGAIVCCAAEDDARVRVLAGGPLLPGWKGKPNALRQLAPLASGEMLLLTDADCVFAPHALSDAVRHRERVGADCLSLMPYLRCETFWEQVVVPLQYDVVFLTLPLFKVRTSPNPLFAAANGAFLLLPRAVYHSLGGHEAVKAELAEDLKFAQHVKRSGRRLVYEDGSLVYSVRMYDSFRTLWEGFSRNLFPAMGARLPVLITFFGFHLITQVLPFVFGVTALLRGDRSLVAFYLPLLQTGIALGIRLSLTIRFRQALWAALFCHPLGWLLTLGIALNSAYLGLSGKGHTWKGRLYRT